MRLTCPHCGERDHHEFSYLGDAAPQRPPLRKIGRNESPLRADIDVFEYVHIRENPAGRIRELWHHAGGCRAWLVVERDTVTHAVSKVAAARPSTGAGAP